MAKYRKNPIVVEAVQFKPQNKHDPWPAGVISWQGQPQPRDMSHGYIQTPRGKMHVMVDDWIITDGDGEHSLCKNDTFKMHYTRVED